MSQKKNDTGISQDMADDILSRRVDYDLSHWSMNVGNIGQLQTLSTIPVIAGDSIDIDVNAVFRLSPLRRNMYLDAIVDLFAFFVPHRHVYGANWITFLKDGQNEGVTLGTHTMTGELYCCASHVETGSTCPSWLPEGYLKIWNNYFKVPSTADTAMNYFDGLASGNVYTHYGLRCAYPKRIWNSGVTAKSVIGDQRFALVDTDKIDLTLLAQKQGQLKSMRTRDFFARRYVDVMEGIWGSYVNEDTEQRPELLMRQTNWLSGYDVDGTDDATLGTYSGKGTSVGKMQVPRKFFAEHGVIWIMALIRFPPVHRKEQNYLIKKPEPTYKEIAGDPALLLNEPPMTLDVRDYISGATLTDGGIVPYGQWYREQPNFVHDKYGAITGHPFIDQLFSTVDSTNYIEPTEYDEIFSTTQLRHWQCQGYINMNARRLVPDPRVSIYAGT